MSRQTSGQRWCSLVLLALFLSLFLYYGLPSMAFRIGQAIEAGRRDVEAQQDSDPGDGIARDDGAARLARASQEVRSAVVRVDAFNSQLVQSADAAGGRTHTARESAGRFSVAHGCGLMIDRQGWVVTSRRVVNGAAVIRVHLTSYKDPFAATLAGSDAGTDLAVLKFDPPAGDMTVAALEDGAPIEIGQHVMAVGNAYRSGEFLWVGVVNSCGKKASPACCNVHDCIHTTAVNAWNFGGPLLNLEGAVVGINTALREADGLPVGVAVPAATARQVVAQLRSRGQVRRGWLGVFIHKGVTASAPAVPAGDFPERALPAVVDYVVPDSPAAEGGLQAGDVIFRFADASFESALELRRRIASLTPGTRVVVDVERDGRALSRRVVVGQAPATPPQLPGEGEWGIRLLGHLSPVESKQLGVDHLAGVVVQDVAPDRRARALSARDVILSVNGVATPDLATFCREVERLFAGSRMAKVTLEISSSGVPRSIVVDDE